jgi:predicted  nucleic acid-binding Zn-ribbon protein
VRADPADQRRLLDLQQADTALTQLMHRRRHLPEDAELAELTDQVNEVTDRQAKQEALASDLDRDIARVEREIEQVRNRADRDRARQNAAGTSPKELEGLAHELETLARRQSELEEQELELMERKESAEAAARGDDETLAESKARLSQLQARRDATLAQIDVELSAQRTARSAIAAGIPAELNHLYEKLRKNMPIAAALLRQRRCESCRIEQSGGELAELRAAAAQDVVRCDNCRAILVRTEESGL